MRGLDDHITGGRGRAWLGRATCPCGTVNTLEMLTEYGATIMIEEDTACTDCGAAIDIDSVEEVR